MLGWLIKAKQVFLHFGRAGMPKIKCFCFFGNVGCRDVQQKKYFFFASFSAFLFFHAVLFVTLSNGRETKKPNPKLKILFIGKLNIAFF